MCLKIWVFLDEELIFLWLKYKHMLISLTQVKDRQCIRLILG